MQGGQFEQLKYKPQPDLFAWTVSTMDQTETLAFMLYQLKVYLIIEDLFCYPE